MMSVEDLIVKYEAISQGFQSRSVSARDVVEDLRLLLEEPEAPEIPVMAGTRAGLDGLCVVRKGDS